MVSGKKKRTSPIDMAPLPFPTIATESTQLKIKPPAAQKKKKARYGKIAWYPDFVSQMFWFEIKYTENKSFMSGKTVCRAKSSL